MKTKLYTKPEVQVYEVSPTEVMQGSLTGAAVRMSNDYESVEDNGRYSAEYRSSLWN